MLVWDGNSWGDEEKRPQRDGSGHLASLLETSPGCPRINVASHVYRLSVHCRHVSALGSPRSNSS